jgi:hypothetical protein
MICARCRVDSKRKDRIGGRCPHCGGQFAFMQNLNDPVSDMTFARAIEVVSANGQVRWGVEHLHYEISRRTKLSRRGGFGLLMVGTVVLLSVAIWTGGSLVSYVFLIAAACFGTLAFVRMRRRRQWIMPKPQFDDLWKRWCATHGTPKGVIVRRQEIGQSPPRAAEPDLNLYSFDRAVICDRARTVDLLLANNFHFENNCAVLSVNGYPSAAFATVLAMLRRNPRLEIFALHDCTRDGCALARKLASDPNWFLGQRVVDVGLRPVHARNLPNLIRVKDAPTPALGIGRADLEWLATYAAELAVLRPEQILRRLFKSMSKARDDDSDDNLDLDERRERRVSDDDDSFGSDFGGDDGGADSFG